MPKQHDVIIVGAGIVGLSVAWQIARRAQMRVLVLDKGTHRSPLSFLRFDRDPIGLDGHSVLAWPGQ